VSSSFTLNGEWQTSRSLGKLKPTMDAAFVRHAGLFEAYPEFIEIRIGSLDEAPSSIGSPQRESWIKRREPWLVP
jgi:hypothetical protein